VGCWRNQPRAGRGGNDTASEKRVRDIGEDAFKPWVGERSRHDANTSFGEGGAGGRPASGNRERILPLPKGSNLRLPCPFPSPCSTFPNHSYHHLHSHHISPHRFSVSLSCPATLLPPPLSPSDSSSLPPHVAPTVRESSKRMRWSWSEYVYVYTFRCRFCTSADARTASCERGKLSSAGQQPARQRRTA
jgi:hypothetical protein